MNPKRVVVLGAGGHAKVVISTLRAAGYEIEAVFDDDVVKHGTKIMGMIVVGPISEAVDRGFRYGIIGVGQNSARRRIAERIIGLEWVTVVHPRAWVEPTVRLGEGTVVFAGALIQVDTSIGRHAIINTGASLDHDCVVGDFSHIAPGARLAGQVTLDEGVFLGTGGVVIPGKRIGAWTTVGAGSVVVADLPAQVVAMGVPARPKRTSVEK